MTEKKDSENRCWIMSAMAFETAVVLLTIVTPTLYIYIYTYANEELCRIYVSWEIDYRQRKFCDFITLSLLTSLLEL